MLVALGKNDIKTLEDFAYCAADDLVGWSERKDGETTRYEGALSGFDLTREQAEGLVMAARVKAGLVSEADLAAPAEPVQEEAAAV
jgi:N utilization substance protein A